METAVEDEAAISFAVAFYDVLGSGGNYERAFRLAANALELEDKLTAANPVLVKSPTAGSVPPPIAVPVAGAARRPSRQSRPPAVNQPPQPAGRAAARQIRRRLLHAECPPVHHPPLRPAVQAVS